MSVAPFLFLDSISLAAAIFMPRTLSRVYTVRTSSMSSRVYCLTLR